MVTSISFVKPNYDSEKRVALLPSDIDRNASNVFGPILIERGFGEYLGIEDREYERAGCILASRAECYESEYIFNLKLIQPQDYPLLKRGTKIIGWMHPNGSGKEFCNTIAREKELTIFDIDSIYPRIYHPDGTVVDVQGLPPHFLWKNSYIAGQASIELAFSTRQLKQKTVRNVCVLGSGSVSQGAFQKLSALGYTPRMFYRKTLNIFRSSIHEYDLIVNGIEVDRDGIHIISRNDLERTHEGVFIVDAAADAGRAIEGTRYNKLASPVGYLSNRPYVLVNNAPTLMHAEASKAISEVVSGVLFKRNVFDRESSGR